MNFILWLNKKKCKSFNRKLWVLLESLNLGLSVCKAASKLFEVEINDGSTMMKAEHTIGHHETLING